MVWTPMAFWTSFLLTCPMKLKRMTVKASGDDELFGDQLLDLFLEKVGESFHRRELLKTSSRFLAWCLSLSSVGRPGVEDAALVDEGDPVGEELDLEHVVGGEQDRRPLLDVAADDLPDLQGVEDVEARGRLVEDGQHGLGHQGPGQEELAGHALAVGADLGLQAVAELGDGHGPVDELLLLLGGPGVEVGHEVEVIQALHVLVGAGLLGQVADLLPDEIGFLAEVVVEEGDLAGGGGEERGDDAERRRLAGPVRADQGEDLPGADVEIDAGQGRLGAVGFLQSPDCQDVGHGRLP